MVFNDRLRSCFHKMATKVKRRGHYKEIMSENHPLLLQTNGKVNNHYSNGVHEIMDSDLTLKDIEDLGKECFHFFSSVYFLYATDITFLEESTNIWEWPSEDGNKAKCWWTLTWPISFVLYMTTPTTRNYPKMYVITFMMCIFWIGSISYLVAWLITVIGKL